MSDETFSHPVFKTREEFDKRMFEVIAEEDEWGWYYLSFADDSRPKGERWLGCCFVQARGVVSAAATASMFECNPGGEIACWGPLDLPDGPREGYAYRLLTKEEAEEANPTT